MATFIRIKSYIINLENIAYVVVSDNHIDFGFAFHSEDLGRKNYIRLERGDDLRDPEFEQVKEFLLELPEADRVIVL